MDVVVVVVVVLRSDDWQLMFDYWILIIDYWCFFYFLLLIKSVELD
jgi:hypothetical protein